MWFDPTLIFPSFNASLLLEIREITQINFEALHPFRARRFH